MKRISVDFDNNVVCIMTAGQQGTERHDSLKKAALNSFIPEKYRGNGSFTWDFENETFSVNQPYRLHDGGIMTSDSFVPEIIVPMRRLGRRFEEFVAILGYEEVSLKEELPAELLRKLFGLD